MNSVVKIVSFLKYEQLLHCTTHLLSNLFSVCEKPERFRIVVDFEIVVTVKLSFSTQNHAKAALFILFTKDALIRFF